ncbi:MAG: NRDE family protein [Burkholderiales bacterium]|jgi:uncharacterized protein with NRDE domain|nr:NRDE family protein [Burkholderiales bacterium]
MCLAVVAWQSHPDYPLVLASNRDEFYSRRSRPAAWWGQRASMLAGFDEEAGGAWLGINRGGRFALVTNVRAPSERNPHASSRGQLVVGALASGEPLPHWLAGQVQHADAYNGFNLLAGEVNPRDAQLHYFGNRAPDTPRRLEPGVYGLSNALLDTPWPKVTRAVAQFACAIARRVDADELLQLLADREPARERDLPRTGVPLDWERALSAIQIRANGYGTRASTVLTVRRDGLVTLVERSFDVAAPETAYADRRYEFTLDTAAALGRAAP